MAIIIVGSLVKGPYGPSGSCAVLRANQRSGASVVSAIGGRFLEGLVEQPIGCLVLTNTASSQHENEGDGSLFATFVACSLIKRTLERGPLPPAARAITATTFHRCLEWCVEHLQLPSSHCLAYPTVGMPLRVSHLPSMLALLHAILAPKKLAAHDAVSVDAIAVQVLQAFLATCPEKKLPCDLGLDITSATNTINAGIRIHKVIGSRHDMSRCIEGVIIDTPMPVGPSYEQRLEYPVGGRVLLFTVPLDVVFESHSGHSFGADTSLSPFEISRNVAASGRLRCKSNSIDKTRWVPKVEQDEALAAMMVGACQQLGVSVVISQRVISRHLQEQLMKAGVLPLERVSVRHVQAVMRLTGAQPLGTWCHKPKSMFIAEYSSCAGVPLREWAESLGVCGAISSVHLGCQSSTLIRPPSQETWGGCIVASESAESENKVTPQPVATLVLCAPTEPEMRELCTVVQAATRVGMANTNTKAFMTYFGSTNLFRFSRHNTSFHTFTHFIDCFKPTSKVIPAQASSQQVVEELLAKNTLEKYKVLHFSMWCGSNCQP